MGWGKANEEPEEEIMSDTKTTMPTPTPPIPYESRTVIGEQNVRGVTLGEKLFEFSSLQDCLANADLRLLRCGVVAKDVVCIDAAGRICRRELQFQRAHQEGTFPVCAYNVNPPEQTI
jgi:hypothetical protein